MKKVAVMLCLLTGCIFDGSENLVLAQQNFSRCEFEKVIDNTNKALETNYTKSESLRVRALFLMAKSYEELGDTARAEAVYQQLVDTTNIASIESARQQNEKMSILTKYCNQNRARDLKRENNRKQTEDQDDKNVDS